MLSIGVTAAMVALEFSEVSLSTITKAAMKKGMSQYVYTVYSNALGFFVLLFSHFIYNRKRSSPPLSLPLIFRIFLLGVVCTGLQLCMNIGIKYSSPTLSSAMVDLTPAFTFLLAIIFRMEKPDLRLSSSQAKLAGTILSIFGALIVTLYQGQAIASLPSQNSDHRTSDNLVSVVLKSNWVIGGIFCAVGAWCLSILYIVQTWIIRDYPEELTVTLITCVFVTLLSTIISIFVEKDPNAWTLEFDIKLLTIVYSAVFAVGLRSVVHTWACRLKGPVYAAMFKPLGMIIAIILGVSFLGDTLYIGSVLGAIIIASGFYSVLWGKAQEEKVVQEVEPSSSKAPLLQDKIIP